MKNNKEERVKNMKNKLSIVLICDDNYILPTSAAIASMINSKNKESMYSINIVAASLSDQNEEWFKKFSQENVEINIIRQDAKRFESLHTFDEGAICVASIAALLKFVLPELLPECDKVLYLDGDILVKQDLSELYNTDVNDYLAGVVVDSGSIYYKHAYVQRVENYFNSGVMLLNLKKFREEDITAKLIKTKGELKDSNLMDQNVFNIVLDGRIKLLPIYYNFLPVNLKRSYKKWTIDQINEVYNTNYENKKELFNDGAIIHYSSKDKPWKVSNVPFASDWYKVFLSLNWTDYVNRYTLGLEEDDAKVKVSVIIPVYNVGKYLYETLESVLSQTLSEIEIICINDGSTDQSQEIIENLQKVDSRIKLVNKENEGQAIARNIGIEMATGKYIYFMDSDDLIAENCLEKLYKCAEKNELDLLLFDGTSFYENEQLEEEHENYKTYYMRKRKYEGVYNGQELYASMVDVSDYKVSPCLQFLRTEYVHEKNIKFPEGIIHEDNLLAYYAIILAERVMHISDVLFYRRVRESSTMTTTITYKNFVGYYVCVYEMMKFLSEHEMDHNATWRTNKQIAGYVNKLKRIYDNFLTDEEREHYLDHEKLNLFSFDMLVPVFNQANSSVKLENQVRKLKRKLKKRDNEIKVYKKKIKALKTSRTFKVGKIVVFVPHTIKITLKYLKKKGFKATIKRIGVKLKRFFK